MNKLAIVHETKSRYSYVYKDDKLHIRIKTGKGEVKSIHVKAGDQFDNIKKSDGSYGFNSKAVKKIDMIKETETEYHDIWFAEISGIISLRIKYAFFITDIQNNRYIMHAEGIYDYIGEFKSIKDTNDFFNFPCLNPEDVYVAPEWSKNAIWYQFTATCYSDDGLEAKDNTSGNLKGLIKKLDYIKNMGYTIIYMTPIFEATTWHLYDTVDYYKVDSKLGSNDDLKLLVDTAHSIGLKVILDGVFNHCGNRHKFWLDVMKNGEKSKYYECFCPLDKTKPLFEGTFKSEEEYLSKTAKDYNFATFAYTLNMPKLNFSSQIIRDYILDIGKYWVEKYNIDGWRLDVSNEVPHEFWREFRKTIKSIKPDAFLLGENWDDAYPWLMGDQFDSVMNYGIMNAIRKYLNPNHKEFKATNYMYAINELSTKYPKNVTDQLFNMVSTHDVDRILNVVDMNDKLVKIAYLLLLTYSGSPCIYYGDEVGISGREYENRVPMIFNPNKQNLNILECVQKLIKIRKSAPVLSQINTNWLHVDDINNSIIFNKENYYIIVNNNSKKVSINLPNELKNKQVFDVYNECEINLSKTLNLSPFEFYILSNK